MTVQLLLVQALNGLQFGVLLFLVAAGLTLVFGVMDFINLAHGVQYMLGAYLGASLAALTGSFWVGAAAGPAGGAGLRAGCWNGWCSGISMTATTCPRCWRPSASSCS